MTNPLVDRLIVLEKECQALISQILEEEFECREVHSSEDTWYSYVICPKAIPEIEKFECREVYTAVMTNQITLYLSDGTIWTITDKDMIGYGMTEEEAWDMAKHCTTSKLLAFLDSSMN
jgi:hypothetical protein